MKQQPTHPLKTLAVTFLLSWLLLAAYANTQSISVRAAPLLQASCTLPATVTTANQLYNCITAANANGAGLDTITLGANINLTTLTTSPLPQITSAITLEGAGYAINGGGSVQLFYVRLTGNFTVNQTTLQYGYSIVENGGAIYNSGTLNVTNSTVSGNSAFAGGAIFNVGTLTVTDSTISYNSATNTGGGISNQSLLIVTNSTFSDNSANTGGAILNTGELHLAGNIFAAAPSGENCSNSRGTINDNGYNLSDDGTCTNGGPGSATNATLNLGALADNGGATQTHLPGAGSDAIGAIPYSHALSNNGVILACNGTTTDQIGNNRPINAGTACTSGAVEVALPVTSLTIIKDAVPAIGTDFDFAINSTPLTSYSGSTSGNPFWTRPNEGGACTLSANSVRYHVQAFMVDVSGTYNMVSNQNYDGYLHLYQDSFNPLDQCANYLYGDNDSGISGNNQSEITYSLEPGRIYYLVTSGFASANAGTFTNIIGRVGGGGNAYTLYDSFTLDDASPDDGDSISSSITYNVTPDTYTITELLPNNTWDLTNATCTGASGSVSLTDETLSVAVGNGEAVECTFRNESFCPASSIVTTADELYACISLANDNGVGLDTITLGADIDLTTLTTSPLPQIASTITLEGVGYAIDGGDSVQLFYVRSNGDFTVNQAILQNGYSTTDGGGINSRGTLTVSNSTLSSNSASYGGSIYNDGVLTIASSTVSNNSAIKGGGGIYLDDGSSATITDSTISSNFLTSVGFGGGIGSNDSVANTLTIINSTFSGNRASGGPAIKSDGTLTLSASTFSDNIETDYFGILYVASGQAYLAGNVFGNNSGSFFNCGSNSGPINTGTIIDNGYNLSDDSTCINGGTGSVRSATLNLGALADNGGPTLTHLPGTGSDAIGAIPNGTTISNNGTSWTCNDADTFTDQRGVARPVNTATACTAGAVEVAMPPLCPSWTAATADELYDCITLANANESPSPTADTITLGADIDLTTLTTSPLPQITTGITLEAAGYAIDGGWDGTPGSGTGVRIFDVPTSGDLTINQATLQNGEAVDGGAINHEGGVTVTNSTLFNNRATDFGGAIHGGVNGSLTVAQTTFYSNSAAYGGAILLNNAATIENSTFSGNSADSWGGGILNAGSLTVTNSTFSGNSATDLAGAIYTDNNETMHLAGNLFAAGASGANCVNNGTFTDNGYNLSDDSTCTNGGTGSLNNATLNLGDLADNGGPTWTHLPGAGSDAIGAIPNGTTISNNGTSWTCNQSFTDQRGVLRPINAGTACTAGAVEVARVQLTMQPNGYFSWLPTPSGSCTESLYRSSTPYVGHTWLTDDPANYDGSGSLTSVAINYFYYLLVDCGGSLSQSNEVGEFTFAIVPGG